MRFLIFTLSRRLPLPVRLRRVMFARDTLRFFACAVLEKLTAFALAQCPSAFVDQQLSVFKNYFTSVFHIHPRSFVRYDLILSSSPSRSESSITNATSKPRFLNLCRVASCRAHRQVLFASGCFISQRIVNPPETKIIASGQKFSFGFFSA
jgi:hypothetical protein